MKKALFLVILAFALFGCGSDSEKSNTLPTLTASIDPGPPLVVNLSWSKIDRAIYYEISRDFNLIATETSTSFSDIGPFTSGYIYIYKVRAYMKDLTGFGHIYGPNSAPVTIDIP